MRLFLLEYDFSGDPLHAVAVLHRHLQKAVPSIHGARLQALMAAGGAVLGGAQVSIMSLRPKPFQGSLYQTQDQAQG